MGSDLAREKPQAQVQEGRCYGCGLDKAVFAESTIIIRVDFEWDSWT
jgi:hypothetical protein